MPMKSSECPVECIQSYHSQSAVMTVAGRASTLTSLDIECTVEYIRPCCSQPAIPVNAYTIFSTSFVKPVQCKSNHNCFLIFLIHVILLQNQKYSIQMYTPYSVHLPIAIHMLYSIQYLKF